MTAREAWAQVAHDLRILADDIDKAIESPASAGEPRTSPSVVKAGGQGAPSVVPSGTAPLPPTFDELPPEEWQEAVANLPGAEFTMQEPNAPTVTVTSGSLSVCPSHRKEYLPSKFKTGEFYCPAKSDDSDWSRKGYCSITPKNVDKWLRQHAGAPAA